MFKNHPKSIANGTKINDESLKIIQNGALGAYKSLKIEPWGRLGPLGRLWDARSPPRRATPFGGPRFFRSFGGNGPIWGTQLGRKGVPKSHFLTTNQHKIVKKSLQEGFQN